MTNTSIIFSACNLTKWWTDWILSVLPT